MKLITKRFEHLGEGTYSPAVFSNYNWGSGDHTLVVATKSPAPFYRKNLWAQRKGTLLEPAERYFQMVIVNPNNDYDRIDSRINMLVPLSFAKAELLMKECN